MSKKLWGIAMSNSNLNNTNIKKRCLIPKSPNGLQSLVNYYRKVFKIEENYNYYGEHDYKSAQREFVKYALANRITI